MNSRASHTDTELLRAWCVHGDPESFNEVVRRHVHLVHAAALRQTRDPHLADDVTQAVFIVLARRAGKIRDGALTGWLVQTARYAALGAMRLKSRRKFHEQKAAAAAATWVEEPSR